MWLFCLNILAVSSSSILPCGMGQGRDGQRYSAQHLAIAISAYLNNQHVYHTRVSYVRVSLELFPQFVSSFPNGDVETVHLHRTRHLRRGVCASVLKDGAWNNCSDRQPTAVLVTYLTVPRSVEVKSPSPGLVQGRGEDGPGSGPQDVGNLMGHLWSLRVRRA